MMERQLDPGIKTHHDVVFLRYLLRHERDAQLETYIFQRFEEPSWGYQLHFMFEHPYFANKVLDDFEMANDEKISKFVNILSYGKSKIITIIGGRGSGKSAFAMSLVEKLYTEGKQKKIYYVKKGDRPKWCPDWMHSAQAMEEVPNGSFAIIDETAIEYGSRNFYTDENKSFAERLVILRHKDISVLLITQHSKMIDINIRRLSDILIYKAGANIEQEGGFDEERKLIVQRLMPKDKQHALLEIKEFDAFWQIETGLASFWDDEIVSKTFADFNPEQKKREERTKRYKQELKELQDKEDIRVKGQAIREAEKQKLTKEYAPEDELFE